MYQISYYHDRAQQRPAVHCDNIGERAIAHYPAPTGAETAFARHSQDRSLDLYGWDGEWRREPPCTADEAADRRWRADFAARCAAVMALPAGEGA